jgi:hypothetical protein
VRAFTTRRPGGARAIAPALGIAPASAPEHAAGHDGDEHEMGGGSHAHHFGHIAITDRGPAKVEGQ